MRKKNLKGYITRKCITFAFVFLKQYITDMYVEVFDIQNN